ncbi:hypothetical protein GCM10007981_18690 [Thermocladium modestius]|uniref:Uncharacterized protein n=1 Tax=Thermocladium modestius TaxID=62609 RepID=A0A830GYH5_9CREN|nr:hypothetical protein [Thermocladium modestius]GGP22475.1 hypothetical protein GCM10007981_18690 [Thermocladium modestius]
MDEQVKALVKSTAKLIETAISVKPTDCILKNLATITGNALAALKMLVPEIAGAVDELAPKFEKIQEMSKSVTSNPSVEAYIESVMSIFSKFNVDPGIWAAFTTLEAMYAIQLCGNEAAKYFLVRTILAGSLPFNLYVAMLNHVGVDNQFGVELFKSLLSQSEGQ